MILPDQAQEEEASAYHPTLTINWTSVVPMGSIQELFKEDIALITGAEATTRPIVRRVELGETLGNWEIRPLLCKWASG